MGRYQATALDGEASMATVDEEDPNKRGGMVVLVEGGVGCRCPQTDSLA